MKLQGQVNRHSIVGAIVSTKTAPKMPTSEVDQGSDSASSTATMSLVFDHAAGSRHVAKCEG